MKTLLKTLWVATALLASSAGVVAAQETLDRTVLPIAEPKPPTYKELDARNAKAPARFEVKAPKGAPNVVIVLIDDIGFGGPSTFGGPIQTPTLDALANEGLRFNNFHTTALCSPTRNALKTGRNHHTTNTGSIMETATAFPGNTGQVPNSVAPLAEMLRLNGYSTAAFGKWHETAAWETSVSGPYDRWPTHQGFDKFYGFIGGETDQWFPLVYDGVTKVDPPKTEGYHFTVDMTNQAINWVKAQQSMTPDKPFFVYFATGAVHAPHHVPKEWADKYKGQFDKGWDQVRRETIKRQKKLGVIPANTQLAPRPEDIKDWEKLPAEERRLFARQGEVAESPRREIFYFDDGANLNALRYNDWKVTFQILEGNFFNGKRVTPNMPFVVNLRQDPFERFPSESMMYLGWMQDKLWAFMPAQVVVGQFLQSFQEFPPSQKSGSFGIGQALDAIQGAGR
jgi:arylsulfatase